MADKKIKVSLTEKEAQTIYMSTMQDLALYRLNGFKEQAELAETLAGKLQTAIEESK